MASKELTGRGCVSAGFPAGNNCQGGEKKKRRRKKKGKERKRIKKTNNPQLQTRERFIVFTGQCGTKSPETEAARNSEGASI